MVVRDFSTTHSLASGGHRFNEDYEKMVHYFQMEPRTTAVGEKEARSFWTAGPLALASLDVYITAGCAVHGEVSLSSLLYRNPSPLTVALEGGVSLGLSWGF
jgi:hypothetical protein